MEKIEKKWQSSYSSHFPQRQTARANEMASLKSLNKYKGFHCN